MEKHRGREIASILYFHWNESICKYIRTIEVVEYWQLDVFRPLRKHGILCVWPWYIQRPFQNSWRFDRSLRTMYFALHHLDSIIIYSNVLNCCRKQSLPRIWPMSNNIALNMELSRQRNISSSCLKINFHILKIFSMLTLSLALSDHLYDQHFINIFGIDNGGYIKFRSKCQTWYLKRNSI